VLEVVGSTVPRRQLGRYLQQRRTEGNLSVRRVCAELGCSPQKLWRIESGLATVKVPRTRIYGVAGSRRIGRWGMPSSTYSGPVGVKP
jgi:hypothetical protein